MNWVGNEIGWIARPPGRGLPLTIRLLTSPVTS